jgi:branched-chain amino acid transport system permease protein
MVVLFTARLYRSNIGREFQAIGEDMFTAESVGIYTTRQKVVAFVISSVIVGFTGSLHAHYTSFISDTTFEMVKAIEAVIYNVVGGMGSIVGAIIGTAVMVPLPEFLRGFVAYQIALYGLILILILRFFPVGIWGTVKRIIRFFLHSEKQQALKPLRLSSELAQGFSTDFWGTNNSAEETLLECREITRYFGGLAALTGVSFSVRRGEILGIVGPNGAGKTTLFNVITGILVPSKGKVVFDDENIGGLIPSKINRLGVSRVFQATVLFSEATVRENVTRALLARAGFNGIKDLFKLENRKHQWTDTQARTILKLCGLESASEELAKNLPYGFQRLLGLAMALAGRPNLLLLDEPVAGMSAEERETIADILVKLRENGMTMIIVEHNVDFIMRLCPRIMVLNYGEKIAEGNPEEIRNNPKVIEAFLGA